MNNGYSRAESAGGGRTTINLFTMDSNAVEASSKSVTDGRRSDGFMDRHNHVGLQQTNINNGHQFHQDDDGGDYVHRARIRSAGKDFMQRGMAGSGVASALNLEVTGEQIRPASAPRSGPGSAGRKKVARNPILGDPKVPSKNFAVRNKSLIRRIERDKKVEAENELRASEVKPPWALHNNIEKFKDVQPKVVTKNGDYHYHQQQRMNPSSDEELSMSPLQIDQTPLVPPSPILNSLNIPIPNAAPNSRKLPSHSNPPDDMRKNDSKITNGGGGHIIRSSQSSSSNGNKLSNNHHSQNMMPRSEIDRQSAATNPPIQKRPSSAKVPSVSHKNSSQKQPRSERNFVSRNINSASKTLRRSGSLVSMREQQQQMDEQHRKSHKPGSIPRYLSERKLAKEKLEEEDRKEEKLRLSGCPIAESDLIRRLNSLPVREDTTFLKRRKTAIREQLKEVEDAIKIFSKPKVFVKNDM